MKRPVAIAVGALAALLAACSSILGFHDLSALGPDASSSDAPVDTNKDDTAQPPPPPDAEPETGVDANCGDTMADGKNCGRCGHSCLGGVCGNGVCQPVVMIKSLGAATGIAVDKKYLYVADQDNAQVIRIDKNVADGSYFAITPSSSPLVNSPVDVDVDDTSVYWAEFASPDGLVLSCPTTGCVGNPTVLATSDAPNSVKVVGSSVYWGESIGGRIRRADKTDGGAPTMLVSDDAGVQFERIAVDPSFVYFVGKYGAGRVPTGGGQVGFYNVNLWIDAVATSPRGLFWGFGSYADPAGFIALSTTPPPDGGVDGDLPYTTFSSPEFNPLAIAVDTDHVYWVNGGAQDTANGTIVSCPLTGCTGGETIMARNLEWPNDLVVDDVAVYWVTRGLKNTTGTSTVMKVAKP